MWNTGFFIILKLNTMQAMTHFFIQLHLLEKHSSMSYKNLLPEKEISRVKNIVMSCNFF